MKKFFSLFATMLMSGSMIATAETINLTFDYTTDPSFEYYAETGDWYLGWIDVTDTYVIRFDYLTTEDGQFGHYTLADLDTAYSFLSDYSSGKRVDYSYIEADFTLTDLGDGVWSLSGYVVCDDGNTYNLSGYFDEPEMPVGEPSVTTFSSLDDLAGMTISFPYNDLELDSVAGVIDGIYLAPEDMSDVYANATGYTFNNHVLTIAGFEPFDGAILPEEEMNMLFYIVGIFAVNIRVYVPIHFVPIATALQNTAANVKATKVIENNQMVILRDSKRFNLVGAEL